MGVSLLRYDNGTARMVLPMPIEMPSVSRRGWVGGYRCRIRVVYPVGWLLMADDC
jgi:hypothetical protein